MTAREGVRSFFAANRIPVVAKKDLTPVVG
jgi:hypothetical protein